MRGLGVAVASAAAVVSLVVAPEATLLGLALLPDGASFGRQLLGFAGHEAGLWGSGLAVWLAARRLGWRPRPVEVGVALVAPLVAEAGIGWLFGEVPAAWLPGPGLAIRCAAAAASAGVAWALRVR